MNVKELLESDKLIFHAIRGSHLYGTNTPTSDIDTHGLFRHYYKDWLQLYPPAQKISDEKEDKVFYELRRYVDLALTANPTVIEMMYTPKEFVYKTTTIAEKLFENRQMFITTKCFWSFTGYAFAQLKKSRGKNKKFHGADKYMNDDGIRKLKELLFSNKVSIEWIEGRFCKNLLDYLIKDREIPLSDKTEWKEMDKYLEDPDILFLRGPSREEFCYIIPPQFNISDDDWWTIGNAIYYEDDDKRIKEELQTKTPFRPIPLKGMDNFDLKKCRCSSVEHVENCYRLYRYEDKDDGFFFRDGQIICDSIPKEDEYNKFVGVLVFSKQEYEKDRKDYKSYWEWMANRNDSRWVDQEKGNMDFDGKNLQHTIRLLLSGENIFRYGEPLIRFSGEKLEFLRGIRDCKYDYDYLMGFAEDKIKELEELFKNSKLPHSPNTKKINELYIELCEMP